MHYRTTTIRLPDADRSRHHAAHARQDRTAEAARALAGRAGRDRPLGAAEARHRRSAHRRFGAAGQNRRRRARRQGLPHDVELIWPGLAPPYLELFAWLEGRGEKPVNRDPAPFRPVMLAHAIEEAISPRSIRRLHRRMEMGRHPRAGGRRPRRARPYHGAALFAHRRGHHRQLSGPRAVVAPARRDRRRATGAARGPRADLQRAAAAAEPQSRLAKADQGISDSFARLRSARRRRE